jgi:peptidoglycan hydrolase-like protein with peptidoglycan-binding domain
MMDYNLGDRPLKKGMEGKDVEQLQDVLWDAGSVGPDNPFWKSKLAKRLGLTGPQHPRAKDEWSDGDYGTWTVEALKHFQLRHMAPGNIPLDEVSPLGVADMDTIWALEHLDVIQVIPERTAKPSKSSADLGDATMQLYDYYMGLGIKEPRGRNRGKVIEGLVKGMLGGIDTWTGLAGKPSSVYGPPWCAFGDTGLDREAHAMVFGKPKYYKGRSGHCLTHYRSCKKKGWAFPISMVIEGKLKVPVGASFVMNYENNPNKVSSRGHIGKIAKVIYGKNGRAITFITRECNISNTMGVRKRSLKLGKNGLPVSKIRWVLIHPALLQGANYTGVGTLGPITEADINERTR